RKAKRYLMRIGVPISPLGAVEVARKGGIYELGQLEIAGVDLGASGPSHYTPLMAAVEDDQQSVFEFLMERDSVKAGLDSRAELESDNVLSLALKRRDFERARQLIESGADVNTEKTLGVPFLVDALYGMDREMVDFLIENGVDVNARGTQPSSPLAMAAEKNDLPLMERFIDGGGDVNAPGVTGEPFLIEAARRAEYDELDLLVKHGANARIESQGETLLSIANKNGDGALMAIALRAGVEGLKEPTSGDLMIFDALRQQDMDLYHQLVDHGASEVGLNTRGESLLTEAVKADNRTWFNHLIERDIDVNAVAGDGQTALQAAVGVENVAFVRKLIESGAKIKDGSALLADAYSRKNVPMMELLLNAGASPDVVIDGQRLFDIAVTDHSEHAVRTLLSAGADVGDNLWGALLTKQDGLVALMLRNGADPSVAGAEGRTPLEYALNEERLHLLKPLLDAGADPNPMYNSSESWLARSIRYAQADTAVALLEAGASLGNERCGDGETMLNWAIAHDLTDVAVTLLERGVNPVKSATRPIPYHFRKKFSRSDYIQYVMTRESNITPLMMAAAQRNIDVAKALRAAGATNERTNKYTTAVSIAARYGGAEMMQICYGRDPNYQPRKLVVDITDQQMIFYRDGEVAFTSQCSTGMGGLKGEYATRRGSFVITEKSKDHVSSIYGSKMPWFMRLSYGDFGFHTGVVWRPYASHGCIRLPDSTAEKIFKECEIGDLVIIRE
ncbi:MAG: L,D-transpeptidase family protein, partial [Verrucomicrobiota bacterium]